MSLKSRLASVVRNAPRAVKEPSFARAWLWASLGKPEACFHTSNNTLFDRYPALFAMVRALLVDRPAPRIVSFGCSTGEEVSSLREYFPAASLLGIDINPESIAAARRTWKAAGGDPRIEFRVGSSTGGEPGGSCDAIFALTMFCSEELRVAAPPSCSGILSFAAFDREVSKFAAALKPGGLLIVAHANFRVDDCTDFKEFELVKRLEMAEAPGLPRSLYGADERRVPDDTAVGGIYRRRSPVPATGSQGAA